MSKPSQTQRAEVERLLVERGAAGIHSFELFRMHMPRAAVVICRLRRAGWVIDSIEAPSPNGASAVRYVLRERPGAAPVGEAVAKADPGVEQLGLIEAPPAPQCAILDLDDDWAA